MSVRTSCLVLLLCSALTGVYSSVKADRAVSRRLLTGDSAQATIGVVGRALAQASNLAQGVYHIQSASRLQTCWNYLSIPNCTIGNTVDLYYQDDGSGRQQFNLVPLSGSNLYYLELNSGRSGCGNWLSGSTCPDSYITAAFSDDTSGRQQWYVNSLGSNLYTISLPRGRESCDTFLSASACGQNSTSFVAADTGSGSEHWLITPITSSDPSPSPPPPAALESQVFNTASTTTPATTATTTTSSPTSSSGAATESASEPPLPQSTESPTPAAATSLESTVFAATSESSSSSATTESASEPPPSASPSAQSSPPPPPAAATSLESTVFPATSQSPPPPPMTSASPPSPSGVAAVSQAVTEASSSPSPLAATTAAAAPGCSGKKGVVYDFFFQYCNSVLLTNSDWFINFDAGTGCTDASVISKHQPMVWGTDRLDSSYAAITAKPSYAKPAYVLTFNEPNYAFGGGTPTNIVDPATAASLWPTLMSQYNPLGIGLIAPSAIDCAGDPNCRNTGTAAGWLSAFRDALNANTPGAWDAIHALNHHSYATDFATIQSDLTSLYQQFGKPIWVTEIASGYSSSMEQNVALMNQFVPWANSQTWIERYFWNQATPAEGTDANIQNSYLVNKDADGSGDGSLSVLGQTYANLPC